MGAIPPGSAILSAENNEETADLSESLGCFCGTRGLALREFLGGFGGRFRMVWGVLRFGGEL